MTTVADVYDLTVFGAGMVASAAVEQRAEAPTNSHATDTPTTGGGHRRWCRWCGVHALTVTAC